jgi:hypothetical protein
LIRASGRAALALACLLVGAAVGLAAVAVYAWWWGLLLAAVASLSALWALPSRWYTLAPFALGWWVPLAIAWHQRAEGDYALASSALGYGVIVLGILVVVSAGYLVTLRWPARVSAPSSAPRGAR